MLSSLYKLACLLLGTLIFSGSTSPSTTSGATGSKVHWGRARLCEWQPGEAPIVISVPHGGALRPTDLANRSYGKTVRDGQTAEIGRALADAIERRTGKRPHLIFCHLHRSKLDANREAVEAAQGDTKAETTWSEYHGYIDRACEQVIREHGRGLYIDLHGQSHAENWIEWGYTVSSHALSKEEIDEPTSMRHLIESLGLSRTDLLRGETSLGARTQALGYKSVPSPAHPAPDGGHYFSGGYSTRRHGSREAGTIDGVQLELPRTLRMDRRNHTHLAIDLANVFVDFVEEHYELDWVESE